MSNFMSLLTVLTGLTIVALPAAAETDEVLCVAPSPTAPAGPIDLDAIPMKDATGQKAVTGVSDDECDETPVRDVSPKGENEAYGDD